MYFLIAILFIVLDVFFIGLFSSLPPLFSCGLITIFSVVFGVIFLLLMCIYRIYLQCRRPWLKPWVRKIPWRRKWQSTPLFLLGESHGQRSLAGYSPCHCRVGYDWATNTQCSFWVCCTHEVLISYLCMNYFLPLLYDCLHQWAFPFIIFLFLLVHFLFHLENFL